MKKVGAEKVCNSNLSDRGSFNSIFAAIELLSRRGSDSDVFVGVEFAYGDKVSDLKELVDKVKGYTNLFIIGSLPITFNQTGRGLRLCC